VSVVENGSLAFESLADKNFKMLPSNFIALKFDDISVTLKIANDYPGQPALLMTVYAIGCRCAHNPVVFSFKVAAKLFKLPDFCEGGCRTPAGVAS